ncbi:MAG TPA: hypothetical protein IAC31_07355 [Candidatus Faecousia intestinigallinarum]|nr:hypothetical protein [Candidatus Faecousia intestinigallinarum]
MRRCWKQLYCVLFFSFLLGIHDGYIALWVHEDPEPIRVFPYSAASFPLVDQAALAQGIVIPDKAQLIRRLEDFLS